MKFFQLLFLLFFVLSCSKPFKDGFLWFSLLSDQQGSSPPTTEAVVTTPKIEVSVSSTAYASASTYNFGSVAMGSSSSAVTFTIANTGTNTLNITSATISGTHNTDFVLTQPATTSISPSASTTFTIQFTPQAIGSRTGLVTINNNDATNSTYTINLTGTSTETVVTAPKIEVSVSSTAYASASTHSFGSVAMGSSSSAVAFTIANTGTNTLSVTSATISGTHSTDFILTQPATTSISPTSSTTFTIQFTPQAIGSRTGLVTINNNDATNSTYTINLAGIGTGKYIFVSVSTYNGNLKGAAATGIAGADAKCAAEKTANYPSLPGTVYKALVVDGTNRRACSTANCSGGAAENINWVLQAGTYYVKDNGGVPVQVFQTNSAGIFTSLTATPDTTAGKLWWTGLVLNWQTDFDHCSSWSNGTAGDGRTGKSNVTNMQTIDDESAFGKNCTLQYHLLCVQQ